MRTSALAALLSVASFAAPAAAQYANDPFFEWTVPASRALALELIGVKLTLAETFAPPFDDELVERFEAMAGPDWARFGGSLAAADPALADDLRSTLAELGEAAEDGEPTADLAGTAQTLLARAYAALIPAEVRDAPAFKGALILDLLLVEGGVAEGYEEAVENVWEYPGGWAALARVDALWAEIEPLASEQRRADGQEMLADLRILFPNAGPPASTLGWNPEEAEAPAQRLGGIVEEVADASLYPGRDLPRLAGHLAEVTAVSCAAYDAGEDDIAAEGVIAVHTLYAANLADTVDVFAPEANAAVQTLFGQLGIADDEDDEDEHDDEDETEAPRPEAASPADACRGLGTALLEIQRVFGG